jgi:hypothetical protein
MGKLHTLRKDLVTECIIKESFDSLSYDRMAK